MLNRLIRLLAIALTVASCGDDKTGIPQPDPIPNLMRIRSMGGSDKESQIDIVGLDEATAGPGKVSITSLSENLTVEATNSGSFFASILAKKGQAIEIKYKDSEAVELEVLQFVSVVPEPDLMSGEPPISVPQEGKTKIVGKALPETPVTAVNITTGDTATSEVDTSGIFEVFLPASSGDTTRVYLEQDPMGPPWEQQVP